MPVIDRDMGYKALMARLAGMYSVAVLVGVESDGGSPDVVDYAAWNEFGTATIPERSFLRSTMDNNRAKYLRLQEEAVERMIDGLSPRIAYGAIGLTAVADVRRTIQNHVPPPNAPSTIRRKGFDHPLIETGHLSDSIQFTVEFRK